MARQVVAGIFSVIKIGLKIPGCLGPSVSKLQSKFFFFFDVSDQRNCLGFNFTGYHMHGAKVAKTRRKDLDIRVDFAQNTVN